MEKLKFVPLEVELRRNPELKKFDVQILQEWLKKQRHLPLMTDSELALFLHSNYYHIQPTKNVIDYFYTIRTQLTEVFSNRDIVENEGLKQITNTIVCFPLPQLSPDGYGIIYAGLQDFEPSHYNYTDAVKLLNMILDLWLYQHGIMKGLVIIMELKGTSFGHIGQINLIVYKKFNIYLQNALPVRFKAMHLINSNPVMDTIMNMTKPFLNDELLNKMHLHPNPETLENFNIPMNILPDESGGKAGPRKELFAKELEKLKEHRDWFLYEEKNQRAKESGRWEKAPIGADNFGPEGSFKKLELD